MAAAAAKELEGQTLRRIFITGGSGFLGRELIKFIKGHKLATHVVAAARSEAAKAEALKAGADSVAMCDLSDVQALAQGMQGAHTVFHLAADLQMWRGGFDQAKEINVGGTKRMLEAAQHAGVRRFVHCSTEAVLLAGGPKLNNVDETHPYGPPSTVYPYSTTKAQAEQAVIFANGEQKLETVVVRPRFVWGRGDTVVLPIIMEKIRTGNFAWISGGTALSSTVHVRNVAEGMVRAAIWGRGGQVYFLTDGEPVQFKAFLLEELKTQDVRVYEKAKNAMSVPRWVLMGAAALMEWVYLCLRKPAPLTRQEVALISQDVVVDDRKARRELGYVSHVTRAQGLQELREDASREK